MTQSEVQRVNDAIIHNPYLSIVTRAQWGATSPDYSGLETDWDYTNVVIHHSGGSGKTDPQQIQREQMHPGFFAGKEPYSDIAYHFLVSPPHQGSCTVYQGRFLGFKASSVQSQNTGKLAICHLGNYDNKVTHQSDAEWENDIRLMVETSAYLITLLRRHFSTIKTLSGHRDWLTTECPGEKLYGSLSYLAQATGLQRHYRSSKDYMGR